MKKKPSRRRRAPAPIEPPTTKELLKCWPGGLRALAARIGYAPSSLTWFHQAPGTTFPMAIATQCVRAFGERGLQPFGEWLTLERLRQSWRRRKRAGKS